MDRDRPRRLLEKFGPSWWIRLGGLALLDAVVLALLPTLFEQGATVAALSMLVGTIGINYIFLASRAYPIRWLVPGLVFLILLMVWPIIFTVIIATTNWSTGNFITKDQAIEDITIGNRYLIEDPEFSPLVDYFIYRDPDLTDSLDPLAGLTMLIRDPDGVILYGEPRLKSDPPSPSLLDLAELDTVDEDGDGIPETIGNAKKLLLRDLAPISSTVDDLALDIPGRGRATAQTLFAAILAEQRFAYDKGNDVLIDGLGGTCTAIEGTFVCENGDRLDPGFRVSIGLDNFSNLIRDKRFRDPFLRVLVWNIVFAALVVFLQLAIGLGLALTFNDRNFKMRNAYRTLLIIPYAAPAFISVTVWRGLFNQSFGPVNRLIDPLVELVRDSPIPWLTDGLWAKAAVVIVTVWQGFPYFMLISMGALQSIPSELQEAARVDGANAGNVFRRVTFPLLMVSIAPLIVASYAFNFNAFVNIFLLTEGGPPLTGYAIPVGETDILISFTYNLAISTGRGGQLALASASAFFIFFIVAGIAAISFRFTRRLETIYGNL